MHIIKEQLGQQVGGTGLLLKAQVGNILGQGSGFGVAFGVAGSVDIKFRLGLPHKLGQVACVGKVRAFGAGGGAVAAQSQHVAHTGGIQLVQQLGGLCLIAAHADHVGQRLYVQVVFQEFGHFHSGNAARGAACTVSNADKIRVKGAHGAQGVLHFIKVGGLLRGEALDGKHARLALEHLGDLHRIHPPVFLLLSSISTQLTCGNTFLPTYWGQAHRVRLPGVTRREPALRPAVLPSAQ